MRQTLHLSHWGIITQIYVSKLAIISLVNGLSPGGRQAIISTYAKILLIDPLGIKLKEILIEIYTFAFKKMHLKLSFTKWQSFCLGLSILKALLFTLDSARNDEKYMLVSLGDYMKSCSNGGLSLLHTSTISM